MGNNLAAIAPNIILPVEKYLEGHVFETQSLGSTRFMKVVRAKNAPNVSIVAKVFVIPDPKLADNVDKYKEANRLLTEKLIGSGGGGKAQLGLVGDCCLPYDHVVQDCNYSGRFLTRAYLAANLFDRLSTRPFLTTIERKFVAFQIIVAIARAHSKVVRHGDLKLENILLTSWNWVQVSDFAFFKPVYLPDNNPSGFNFYFDASRRRTCNIAPERFISGGDTALRDERFFDIVNAAPSFDSSGNYRDLMPSMDIFSLGCVIGQLFAETHLFNLSQLLSYKSGSGYDPSEVINQIADEGIRKLVFDMIKVNPSERKSADEYLCEHRGVAFPEYFYTILYNFMRAFTTPRSSDRNIVLMYDHYPSICEKMRQDGFGQQDLNDMTLIVFSLLLSNIRSIQVAHSKLCALRLIEAMCENLDSDEILIRGVPCLVFFLQDSSSKVVSTAISCLTNSLSHVTHVSRSQRKVFVEYIFPDLLDCVFTKVSRMAPQQLQNYCVESVHHEFVRCFPRLVDMSLKFLDLSIEDSWRGGGAGEASGGTRDSDTSVAAGATDFSSAGVSYDEELRVLRNAVSEFYLPIFVKASGMTKQVFLESDMVKLCAFHGNQPDQDPLAQYLPTCASVAAYWPLNESYFKNIVKMCAYYGDKATKHNALTFIEQGIHNTEEFVIVETLSAVRDLYRMSLIDGNENKLKLFEKIVPLLLHPNPWIRLNTARAIAEASESVGTTTARGYIYPRVNEYARNFSTNNKMVAISPPASLSETTPRSLQNAYDKLNVFKAKWGIGSVTNTSFLLSSIDPIRRFSYDKLCAYSHSLEELLNYCESLVLVKNIEEKSQASGDFSALEFPEAFTERDKVLVQALYFEDRDSGKGYDARPDLHKTKLLKDHVLTRQLNIYQYGGNQASQEGAPSFQRNFNDLWLQEKTGVILVKANDNEIQKYRLAEAEMPFCSTIKIASGNADTFSIPLSYLNSDRFKNKLNFDKLKLFAKNSSVLPDNSTVEKFAMEVMGGSYYTETPCMGYLRVLARHWKRNNRRRVDYVARQREKMGVKMVAPWRPTGSYVASLHDHSAAVNQLAVSPSNLLFASCSNDGSVRIWNPIKWELNHQDPLDCSGCVNVKRGPVKSLAFMSSETIVTCLQDALQLVAVNRTSTNRPSGEWEAGLLRSVGVSEEGSVVSMTTNENNVVTVSTNNNTIFGWDLRSKGLNNAYYFQTKPHDGLISSMVVADNGLCVVLGSSLGRFSIWDLRFLMPVKTFAPHVSLSVSNRFKVPAVHRLKRHPFDREAVIASMRGHYEVAVWKLESGSRSKIFWSSSSDPLNYQQPSSAGGGTGTGTNSYAMGFYAVGETEADFQIISASHALISDMGKRRTGTTS